MKPFGWSSGCVSISTRLPSLLHSTKFSRNPAATELRKSNLNPLRNQLTFHFFEDEVGEQLTKGGSNPRFLSGHGETNADVYYELADVCALGAFSGLQLDKPEAVQQFAKLAQTATDVAIRFVEAAETFIAKTLIAGGWQMRDQSD